VRSHCTIAADSGAIPESDQSPTSGVAQTSALEVCGSFSFSPRCPTCVGQIRLFGSGQVKIARTSGSEARGSGLVLSLSVAYSRLVSRLRRPFLSDRYFFITVRLLKERGKLVDADFHSLALALNRSRAMHPFFLAAWVFLPDHWHLICAPLYPLTISLVMKSIKTSSMILINRRRAEAGELWQPRFFDCALRTVKEYGEKVEYLHLNSVKAGLAGRPQDWRWSSVHEYSGMSAEEQKQRCGLNVDRVLMPSEPRTLI
jgi:putative transposase